MNRSGLTALVPIWTLVTLLLTPGLAGQSAACSWSPLAFGPTDLVRALAVYDDGTGADVYAGGDFFAYQNGQPATHVARWLGNGWANLPSDLGAGQVMALLAFDDGTGSALYAGGWFSAAGGLPAAQIARWDGTSWSPLGPGLTSGSGLAFARAMTVFDDGSGPALFVGGDFQTAGGVPAANIARWDGASWSPLGAGVAGRVSALHVFDDGSGPALYVGGSFAAAGGLPVNNIARWDGSSWSGLGNGVGTAGDAVRALTAFDDGSGLRFTPAAASSRQAAHRRTTLRAGAARAGPHSGWDWSRPAIPRSSPLACGP